MTKRIIVFVIVLALIAGAGFAYYYFVVSKKPPLVNVNQGEMSNANTNSGQLPPERTNSNLNVNKPAVVVDPVAQAKNDVSALAISFVERFGSYSNQSNFSNITELKPFMTRKMSRWADDYAAKLKEEAGSAAVYHGFSTRVLKIDFTVFDLNGSAIVLLSTQREEQTGSRTNSRTFYQNIKLDVAKESGVWKVAGAYWE